MNLIPAPLASAFKEGKVILFVGSGFSKNFGFPLFKELIDEIDSHFFDDPMGQEYQFYNKLNLLEKTQYLSSKYKKGSILKIISNIFSRKKIEINESMKYFFSLPTEKIYTTNWDNLIENTYEKIYNTTLTSKWRDEQLILNQEIELIKLHGTIDDPASIILTEKDYYDFMNSDSLIKQQLVVDIAHKSVLFIGYSLSDIDFKQIFYFIESKLKENKTNFFIFTPNPSNEYLSFIEKLGLIPIIYRDESHEEAFNRFMCDLAYKVGIEAYETDLRLHIMHRENSAFIGAQNLILRNIANLGPLATPLEERLIFADEKITELEQKCTKNWVTILSNNGNIAKCIISLDERWLNEKYDKVVLKKRLTCLRDNILKYNEKVLFVDKGYITDINIDIYGNSVLMESRKSSYLEKSYNRTYVKRSIKEINEEINNFDTLFGQLQRINNSKDNSYVLDKINRILNTL
jgi:hypothetical protein